MPEIDLHTLMLTSCPMASLVLGKPGPSEFPPFAKNYVDTVEDEDLLHALMTQSRELATILEPLDKAVAATHRYAPGKWTINDVVGHMTDTERIFSYRLLRVARGDTTPLPGFEQDDYIPTAHFNDRSLGDLLSEFESVRQSTTRLIAGLPSDAWMREGTVSGHPVTARGVATLIAGHALWHIKILRERYSAP
jgi:DinB superfamily